MSTKRQQIDSFRSKLRERNVDSTYTNQFLYRVLMEHAKWLIKREISAGRIYRNTFFFRNLSCQNIIEVSTIDECCPIKTNCKIYRTECKLPPMWIDNDGPVLKTIASVDFTTEFLLVSPSAWYVKKNDPYQKYSTEKYVFYADGYLWFPEHNPHKINIVGFWEDDVTQLSGCGDTEECVRFLDTEFMIPAWLEAEMQAKALEQLAGVTKRLTEDEEINKNEKRR